MATKAVSAEALVLGAVGQTDGAGCAVACPLHPALPAAEGEVGVGGKGSGGEREAQFAGIFLQWSLSIFILLCKLTFLFHLSLLYILL